jgi:EmrB/QacA subfamily drug resistance transporter
VGDRKHDAAGGSVAQLVCGTLETAGPHRDHVCPASQERANRWAVLVLAGTGGFMTALDASIVNISLPSIAHSFGVPLAGAVEWVITAYLVAIGAVLLTAGRLADMIGRKPIFVAGLLVFTVGSMGCGAAPSLPWLLFARAFQGLGAALIFAVNIAMLTRAFPPSERGRALGLNAILVALGISAGPTVGGLLTQHLSWRWIFYVNVPVGAVVVLAALGILTERPRRTRGRFDPAGAALLAVGLSSLTLALSFGEEWGWVSWRTLTAMGVGLGALLAAGVVERRVAAPVIDLALFRSRVFAFSLVSFVLAMLALFAVGFLLPFYFEELRGFDVERSGLLLTPLPLTLAVVAPISGMLADRHGSRWLSPIGLGIACVGLLLLSRLDARSTIGDMVAALVVTGLGQGMFQAPNTRTLMGAAPPRAQGVASGILATGRVIGQSLSVALAGAVFAAKGGAVAGGALAARRAGLSPEQVAALEGTFVDATHTAFVVCAVISAVGVVTALIRGDSPASATQGRTPGPPSRAAAGPGSSPPS